MQSSLPSPMPARSTASASAPACDELWFAFLFPLDFAPYVVSSGSLDPPVVSLGLSPSGSFRHDTLSKSLSIGNLWTCEVNSPPQEGGQNRAETQVLLPRKGRLIDTNAASSLKGFSFSASGRVRWGSWHSEHGLLRSADELLRIAELNRCTWLLIIPRVQLKVPYYCYYY